MAAADAQDFTGRLALGTVQFGLDYGINNTAGRPDDATVAEILSIAQAAGINLLDTAAAYGDSETRLGDWLGQAGAEPYPFALVTKLAAGPAGHVWHAFQNSLKRLRLTSVYGVLFHQFAGFRDKPAAWEVLCDAQAAGLVQRIGVSLYHPEEAEWLLANPLGVSLVQLPFNVFDQRFGPLLPALQRAGIEVHVRSAFLQGLLLRDPATLPAFFAPLAPKLVQLRALAQRAGIPLASLLLLFAAYAPGVGRAVIGVDTAANLRENLAAGAYRVPAELLRAELETLAETTTDFILPYTWPPRP
ncbi:aldo/keto reductase [Hymenobacter monticola]|uniref:Aldo/keto reductase n=1 Tax=Hymenobacter monticola TaxID=1705399 RepID=A0ABY4B2Q8_9BACT|nr:aldo/keto reductase [Hymenobacter monticola]UOE33425.1 aldo/keto reductase [Hymenobacter monticola]